jgi:hypothetical protein
MLGSWPSIYSRQFSSPGLLYPEDGCGLLFRNIGKHLPVYTASHPRKQQPSSEVLLNFFIKIIRKTQDLSEYQSAKKARGNFVRSSTAYELHLSNPVGEMAECN